MNATIHDAVLSHLLKRYGVTMSTADIADALHISITALHQRVYRHQTSHQGTDVYLPTTGRIARGQWSTVAVARWLHSLGVADSGYDEPPPPLTRRKPGRPRRHAPVAGGAA